MIKLIMCFYSICVLFLNVEQEDVVTMPRRSEEQDGKASINF